MFVRTGNDADSSSDSDCFALSALLRDKISSFYIENIELAIGL